MSITRLSPDYYCPNYCRPMDFWRNLFWNPPVFDAFLDKRILFADSIRSITVSLSRITALFLVAPTILATVLATGCTPKTYKDEVALLPVNSFTRSWMLPLNLKERQDSIAALYLREDTLFAYSH